MSLKQKMFLFLFLGFITYSIMMLITLPYISSSGQNPVFDMMSFGYTINDAVHILANLSQNQRLVYLFVQIPLDFIYPLSLGFFTYYAFKLMYTQLKFLKIFLFVPFAMTFFDYFENIFVVLMLNGLLNHNIVSISSLFTLLKSLSVMIVMTLLFIFLCVYFFTKYSRRSLIDHKE